MVLIWFDLYKEITFITLTILFLYLDCSCKFFMFVRDTYANSDTTKYVLCDVRDTYANSDTTKYVLCDVCDTPLC
jgi:hypothetical protein